MMCAAVPPRDPKAKGAAKVIIPIIPTKRHWTRDLASSPDGQRIFVSIGSSTNVAATMLSKTPAEIQEHEKSHGLGAAWGDEENRAVLRVFDPEGAMARNDATGLRNCSGSLAVAQDGALLVSDDVNGTILHVVPSTRCHLSRCIELCADRRPAIGRPLSQIDFREPEVTNVAAGSRHLVSMAAGPSSLRAGEEAG